MDVTDLSAVSLVALDKCGNTLSDNIKKAREELSPGVYEVDVTVRLKGLLQIREDTTASPTPRISQIRLLGVLATMLMDQHGWEAKEALGLIETLVQQTINPETPARLEEDIQAEMARAQERLGSNLKPEVRKGQASFIGHVLTHPPQPIPRSPRIPRPKENK